MQERQHYCESKRRCEDPYFVPGLNHPCNGVFRGDVSTRGDRFSNDTVVNLGDSQVSDHDDSTHVV